ncbi:MAG: hypothetical protein KAY37_10065 [Phycisphaerae bacterium]|nr:hypothetical protein [Phycisphaerae bacterium]
MTATTTQTHNRTLSRSYRLMHTPLGELLHGRLASWVDIDQVITSAELPQPLQELVRQVLLKTRLWHSERADIAHELVAHFQDGLETGASVDELAASFGDPACAARLIRRSKKRNRPLIWKLRVRTTQGVGLLLLLFIVTYTVLAARLYCGSVQLSRNYWEELNTPVLATPEDERAWPLYRQAFLALPPGFKDVVEDHPDPAGADWEKIAAYVTANQEAVRLLRAGARKPHLGYVLSPGQDTELVDQLTNLNILTHGFVSEESGAEATVADNPPLLGAMLYDLSVLRSGAKLLRADAHIAAQVGDGDRFLADMTALLRIAEQATERPFVIADLVSVALLTLTADTLGQYLYEQPELFSDQQLVELAHAFCAVHEGGPFHLHFAGEHAMFHDMVQRMYTDDGAGDGHPIPQYLKIHRGLATSDNLADSLGSGSVGEGLLMPGLSALLAERRELCDRFDYFIGLCEAHDQLPLWQRQKSRADMELRRLAGTNIERVRYLLLVVTIPSFERASLLTEYATQTRDAIPVALALELYRRQVGVWPEALNELTPQLLPQVPPDRYDGGLLKYRLNDGRPVLYSVGTDRDDDGGRLPNGERPNRRAREWLPPAVVQSPSSTADIPDGDWILWPPVK